jgi:uncharacterized protein
MRILRQSEFRVMPWKNGGGEMIDIIASPEAASLDAFDWRVSMARVVRDGPFSVFPGIERSMILLEGEGLTLIIEGHGETRLTRQSPPFVFPGDAATRSRLVAGPILNLNVMTRRGRIAAAVTRHRTAHPQQCDPKRATLLVLLRGATGTIGKEPMQDGDAVLLAEADPVMTLVPHGAAEIILVALRAV